jgi:hypothetical protein
LTVRQFIRSGAVLLALLLPRRSVAQATTNPQVDASVLPRGIGSVRVLTSWTRYDELFGTAPGLAGGPRNLAYSLNTDSVTVAVAPQLTAAENAIRTLSADPAFRLTAGNLVAATNSRVVTAPVILEYGLTKWLTLGAVVPLVETRSTVYAQLNPKLNPLVGAANVGPNPGITNPDLRSSEAALIASFRSASTALQQQLTQCQSNPTPDCASLLAQQSAAVALINTTGTTASAIETLYGGDPSHPGQLFVPIAGSTAENVIEGRIASLIAQYQSLLPSAVFSGTIAGAGGPGARNEMQELFAAVGRDTLHSTDRSGIGDISLGATIELLDTFHDSTRSGAQARVSLHGEYRLGTGEPANRNRMFDVGTGYGQPGVEVGLAADALFPRRLSATVLASYTAQLGTIAVSRIPAPASLLLPLTLPVSGTYSAGNVAALSIIPRWRVAGYFVLNGQYSLTNIGADNYSPATGGQIPGNAAATTQAVGMGFSYSTVGISNPVPRQLPYEVTFSHLETLTGTGGPVAKTFRDQIMLKVYVGR